MGQPDPHPNAPEPSDMNPVDAVNGDAPCEGDGTTDESMQVPQPANSRRRAGRLGQELLQCDLGPILNLSVGGMRITCRKVPPAEVQLMLFGDDEPLVLRARVAWHKRIGLFKHEVGLQFLDIDSGIARRLTTLATMGRMRRCI